MKFYDISLPLSGALPEWPGQTKFERTETRTSAIVSRLVLSSHFGTHVDAPKHFLFNRAPVDQIPLEKLVGTFRVVHVRSKPLITLADVKEVRPKPKERILFKTANSKIVTARAFSPRYVSLAPEAAAYLAERGVWLVGTDYFGIEAKGSASHPVHRALLRAHVVIVEGLSLKAVPQGTYQGAILPLKIAGGDGAPARAVLWK